MPYSILNPLGAERLAMLANYDALLLWQGASKEQLQMALAQSDFIFTSLQQQPSLISWLFERRTLHERSKGYADELACRLRDVCDEEALWRVLRQFRRQELLWLAWLDFTRQIPLNDSLTHLSALAQSIVLGAYHYLYQNCCNLWGTPSDLAGNPQPLLILAMGKLGGEELNFSSDIDLIFAYPNDGQTHGAARSLENVQFFTRLGQRLIKALELPTADGFCYRVDLRLRPYGESGPLVMSFAALESYYQTQGRDWERYAMIKARVLGESDFLPHSFVLRNLLWPFVFRRYSDFSAIDSVRRMKAMIQAELRRRDLKDNIKLGAGGIREIEFIAQTFQLIRGGKEPLLQQRGLLQTVSALLQLELINHDDFTILSNAYSHLRQLENLLQAIGDQQTQALPSSDLDRMRLVTAFSLADWSALLSVTQQHMSAVHAIFLSLFGEQKALVKGDAAQDYQEICDGLFNSLQAKSAFAELAHSLTQPQQELLWQFGQDLKKRTVGARGQEILNQLLPALLQRILQTKEEASPHNAHIVLERVLNIVLAVASRTTYLELLTRYPMVLEPLITLCGKSAMIANQLAAHPMLLDELLLSQKLYQPTPFTQYGSALQEFLARIAQDDQELLMEQIREFKQLQLLRIAAADVAGQLPVMRVSDHLTYLAQAIVAAVVEQTWLQMRAKYGEPTHLANSGRRGFMVLAFGKLGGIELGYASDLDLVFLYDAQDDEMSDGAKSISAQQFYLRLAQRIVHLFA
ncbi:MAG: bifunctional [glutamate--ammonia ligase]-adenylyl-L-tyrosine phosphorylase/[glutamate--ammonia-ligase] adenylyltransferase, partial [Vibrionaceae bacterium]